MKIVSLSAITLALLVAGSAHAQTAPAPSAPTTQNAAPKFSTASTMGDLIANPEAKAVLAKHVPEVLTHPQLDEALGMTLAEVSQYIGGDTVVNAIAADLALIK